MTARVCPCWQRLRRRAEHDADNAARGTAASVRVRLRVCSRHRRGSRGRRLLPIGVRLLRRCSQRRGGGGPPASHRWRSGGFSVANDSSSVSSSDPMDPIARGGTIAAVATAAVAAAVSIGTAAAFAVAVAAAVAATATRLLCRPLALPAPF